MTPEPLPEIHLSNCAYTVSHWTHEDRDREVFDLDAPYQRGSVWSVDQRRNLIRSLIMGLPVGNVIVSNLPYMGEDVPPYRIVDGKQRIEAVRAFFANEFSVPGWWFPAKDLTDPADRNRDVFACDLSQRGRFGLSNAQMGALEFKPGTETTENPAFDPALLGSGGKPTPGNEGNPNTVRWIHRDRTPAEMIQAEAELYLLVNFGGVDQTDEDRARAEGIAQRKANKP